MHHPEVESGLISTEYLQHLDALASVTTSIDLLEIPKDSGDGIGWWNGLDHQGLLKHFEVHWILELPVSARFIRTKISERKSWVSDAIWTCCRTRIQDESR